MIVLFETFKKKYYNTYERSRKKMNEDFLNQDNEYEEYDYDWDYYYYPNQQEETK